MDREEKIRIREAGGKVMQGRVMGVLEPSRAIGVRGPQLEEEGKNRGVVHCA